MELLERQRSTVTERIAELRHDAAVLDDEIAEYRRSIAMGLDCEDEAAELSRGGAAPPAAWS